MQTYANHRKYVPAFHFVAVPILAANFVYAAMQLKNGFDMPHVMAALTALAILIMAFLARLFALKVQDRVIRLEERLRLREVLPVDMHSSIHRLTAKQLVGLRFASDAELPSLVSQVLKDNTASGDIKKMVKDWRPDEHRA
jgi:hypothetical protein